MKILTKRMKLIPFTIEIIQAAMQHDNEQLLKLGITPTEGWPELDLVEALPYFNQQIIDHGVTGYNSWLTLDKQTNDIIGSLGFINEPDSNGSVEIGFGIVPQKRRQGYCEEAVKALITWADAKSEVKFVTARCNKDNKKSINLLKKIGFKEKHSENSIIKWEYVSNAR
jgi:[ribosomal protein S5]-alanine N-acetyltransferase